MSYISQADYTKMLSKLQKSNTKTILKESLNWANFDEFLGDVANHLHGDADSYPDAIDYLERNDTELFKKYNGNAGDVANHILNMEKGLEPAISEGNAFTGGLAKAKKGEKFSVDGEKVVDTSNYDSTDENLHVPPLQATGQTIDTVEEDLEKALKNKNTAGLDYDPKSAGMWKPDYMKGEVPDDDDDDDGDFEDDDEIGATELPKNFQKVVTKDKSRYPFQEVDQVSGFSVLSPDERKQLKEYIESMKTIKTEIQKLLEKAGKYNKVVESGEDQQVWPTPHHNKPGGDRTGRIMTNAEMWESRARKKQTK